MKKATLFLIFLFNYLNTEAQSIKDSTHYCFKISNNRYGLFHRTIRDTTTKTVTKFGHYISLGSGYEHENKYGGMGILSTIGRSNNYSKNGSVLSASYSLAYKSHLLTVTGGFNGFGMNNSYTSGYKSNYIGCLLGESIRFKNLMISLSAGIASTSNIIYDFNLYRFGGSNGVVYSTEDRSISFPVELKAFLLARNGIGIGLHFSENICLQPKYSPFAACICLVTGFWNKPKHKK